MFNQKNWVPSVVITYKQLSGFKTFFLQKFPEGLLAFAFWRRYINFKWWLDNFMRSLLTCWQWRRRRKGRTPRRPIPRLWYQRVLESGWIRLVRRPVVVIRGCGHCRAAGHRGVRVVPVGGLTMVYWSQTAERWQGGARFGTWGFWVVVSEGKGWGGVYSWN